MIMPAAVRVVWLPSAATVDVIYTYTAAQRFLFFGAGGAKGAGTSVLEPKKWHTLVEPTSNNC